MCDTYLYALQPIEFYVGEHGLTLQGSNYSQVLPPAELEQMHRFRRVWVYTIEPSDNDDYNMLAGRIFSS